MDVPNGRIHTSFNFLLWAMFVGMGNFWLNPIPLLIASTLPDADHRNAPMGRILPLWLIWKHRTFTHTVFAMALFSLPFFALKFQYGISFVMGYFLHLVLDSGTPSGVKWLGKNPKKHTIITCLIIGCVLIW